MRKFYFFRAAIGIISIATINFLISSSSFSQGNSGNGQGNGNGGSLPTKGNANLPFWGLHGNTGDSTTFAGTTNDNPFLIKVNNLSRASFTNSGLGVYGSFTVSGNALVDSLLNVLSVMVSDALGVGGNATFNGTINANSDINLAGSKSIKSSTNNASLTFDGFGNTNTIGLGYNINTPDSAQGLVVIPAGNSQYPNGGVLLGDVNPNGEVLIALDGGSGGRFNIRGWEKKTYIVNDGGEKITLDGVNSNSIWETTKGLTLITRSGTTFTDNYHLNIQGNLNSQKYYQNDTLVDLANLQTTVANIKSSQWQNDTVNPSNIFYSSGNVGIGTSEPSVPLEVSGSIKITGTDTTGAGGGGGGGGGGIPSPSPSRSIIIDGGLDRIIATSGTIDFDNTNLNTTGNIQSNSITTTNITITDFIKTKRAEFDTLKVAERFEAERYIQSDTMHALKSLQVNNSLSLKRDTSVMYAEVSTVDTAVALMFQKDAASPVVIGDAPAPVPGEARPKLTVFGNTKLDGTLNVTGNVTTAGNINANCVTASCMNVIGQTSMDTLRVSKIKASRIVPVDGDSLIRFGENTLTLHPALNRIYWTTGTGIVNGMRLGNGHPNSYGLNSIGIGYNVSATGINSITLGSEIDGYLFNNSVDNSFMVGFNNFGNIPTLFVGPGNGTLNSTGNVGVGTSNPEAKFDVRIPVNLNQAVANFKNTDKDGIFIVPKLDGWGYNRLSTPGDVGIFWDGYNPSAGLVIGPWYQSMAGMRITHEGKIGVGTPTPTEKFQVDSGNILIRGTHNFSGTGDEAVLYLGDNNHYIKSVWGEGVKIGSFQVPDAIILMQGNGKVGIGTDDIPSDFKLAVNGKMLAEDVTILLKSDWPDFVYEPNYKRPSLIEREKYHNEFGHMMYMDSAKEIRKNGLNFSKNFIGLTRNVEEMGEDMIEIQKILLKQHEQIILLQKEIETLKKSK